VARQDAALAEGTRPRRTTASPKAMHLSGRIQMSQLVAIVKSLRNEEGQDLLEYALLVALIALIAIGAVGAAGGAVNNIFTGRPGTSPEGFSEEMTQCNRQPQ